MDIILYILILMFSIILHEISHGYAAYINGDDLAYREGRLTLNPISHISIFGSILVPALAYFSFGIPFGWAKPVPYRPEIVRQNRFGELLVSSAGVLMNYFLVFLAVFFYYLLAYFNLIDQDIFRVLYLIALINIILGTFNLLPFPPADGWSIFSELYKHMKNFFNFLQSKITGKHIYSPYYRNERNNFTDKINFFFSNPIMMIIAIFLAVQVFSLFSGYLLVFVKFLFSFQIF